MKKILIFYSKTGGGHFRAAETIAHKINQLSPKTRVVLHDGLVQTDLFIKTNPSRGYHFLSSRLLTIYNLLYIMTNNHYGLVFFRRFIKSIWGDSLKAIVSKERPDLIVTTHHFITPSTISGERKVPFLVVVTDLGLPHKIWFDRRADAIIVPTVQMVQFAHELKVEHQKVALLGYPIKDISHARHCRSKKRPVASSAYREAKNILLIASGLTPRVFKKYFQEIIKGFPTHKVVVVGGHNNQIPESLGERENVEVYGFVDNLDELMSQSDVVITKAGPGTILEAAALHRPMIITKIAGLQERDNVKYVVENKLGLYCPKPKEIVACLKKLYRTYPTFQHDFKVESDGAKKIAEYLLNNLS